MTEQRSCRAGLVGAGYVSEFHLKALRGLPTVPVIGIHDRDRDRAETVARQWGLRVFDSLDTLVAAGANVIHVLTPPASHAAVTLAALERGCDVLVEKPLATSVADCDQIATAAQRAGRQVCVNHSLLRDPFVQRALTLVRAGQIGEVLAVDYFRSSEYTPWPGGPVPPPYCDGGYPFRDLGVHALYLLAEFLGGIEAVHAEYANAGSLSRDPNLRFDEWRALVRGPRATGQIQLSWNIRPLQHQLFIQGTRGTIRADLFSMFVAIRKNTPLPKSVERAVNALNEARQIECGTTGNALRFLRGKLRPFHGLHMLVTEFYQNLAAGLPAPVTVAQARPIVDWTERVARTADDAKTRWLAQSPTTLTAPVLVTGASGFIGRQLVKRLLKDQQRIRVLVRREQPPDPRVEVVVGDLGDPAAVDRAVAGTQLVYHVGATMSGRAEDFQRGTVAGTRHVIDSVLKHRVPKLVYVSSLSVLHAAAARPGVKLTEAWPLEPRPAARGAYTQSKLEAEQLVTAAVRDRGLPAVIVRPGQVFGPGAPLLTPAVARRLGNRLIVLGNGELVLPLVHVADVVEALVCAGRRPEGDGSIFQIVDDAGVTQNDLARRAGRPIVHIPRPVVYALAWGVHLLCRLLGRAAPLSVYRVRSALAPISFDCTAARTKLGWQPVVGTRAGLEQLP